jgi:hypothetical protein
VNRRASPCVAAQFASQLARRRVLQWGTAAACFLFGVLPCLEARAESGVPIALQVLLLSHLGSYDRHFKARAGAVVNVLVVQRRGNSESAFEQASLVKAFADLHEIAGLPVHVEQTDFTDAVSLAKRCRTDRISVLYLTVGLDADLPRLAQALVNGDVLTVGTSARHAENGAVVSFALEEARPRLVINLPQAKAQHVDFRAEVLQLATVIRNAPNRP